MLASKEESIGSQLDDLFGPPPLIRGENAARYWRLHSAFEHDIKPKTFSEKVYVRELTDKLWEQQRYKQNVASLVESAHIEALADLFRPFIPRTLSIDEEPANVMARDYFSGEVDNKRLEHIETQLLIYGITPEQIRAKAMQLCGSGISMFSRMEANCGSSLRMLRKENVRRRGTANAPSADEPDRE
jgi:hypothetical protein